MWQQRTMLFGPPWADPFATSHVPPRVTFPEDTAKQVEEFVEAVRTAGEGARGKKTSQQETYQGKGKKSAHAAGRQAWKKWVTTNMASWKLGDTVDRVMKEHGYDLTSLMKLSDTREVRSSVYCFN